MKSKSESTNGNAPKFRRQFSNHKFVGEINKEPSRTVPDQHLSIAQLLINHSRGLGSDVKHYEGQYFEDEPIPVIQDLTDLAENRQRLKARQLDIEQQISEMEKTQQIAPKDETPPAPTLTPTEEPIVS